MIFIFKAVFIINRIEEVVLIQGYIPEFKKSLIEYRYSEFFIKNYFILVFFIFLFAW